jgi:cytochrome c5
MSHSDSAFFKTFGVVIGALVLFTIFCIVVANSLSPDSDYSNDPVVQGALKDRVGAVGKSRVAAPAPAPAAEPKVETTEQAAAPAAESSGDSEQAKAEETTESEAPAALAVANSQVTSADDFDVKVRAVVATNCAGCHEKGIVGAQRLDDSVSWNKLADKGIDALTASVIDGKGAMPPRAESDLDDEQLREAVKYTLFLAGVNAESQEQSSADASSASTESAAPAATPAATTETVAAADVPDEIKTAVDTVCAACHSAGVANAPKFDDKAAWDARMADGGIDTLLANSIAGKGGMPPRGGTNLTDEQLKLAIGYILAK